MKSQSDKIQAWKNAMIDSARTIYKDDKELVPVLMLFTEEEQNVIIGMPFENAKEQQMSFEASKKLVREHKAIAVIFIYEGYMLNFTKEDEHKYFNPDGSKKMDIKDVEGNKEVVFIVFETKSGEKELVTIEINNQELGETQIRKGGNHGWIFSNFWATPVWVN